VPSQALASRPTHKPFGLRTKEQCRALVEGRSSRRAGWKDNGYVAGPKEFYDGLASEYHVLFEDWWRAAMWHGRIIASLLAARGVGEHSRVLDCTCGIGTQALPLTVLGYNVTGMDLSQRSVERARMEARARGLQIDLKVADVRTMRKVVGGHFDAVISCDNALSHLLTEADLDKAIENVRACLRRGGLLIASVRDYDALAIARPTGIPIALHGPSGERHGAGQAWVWSPAGDLLEIALFTLAEGPNGVWNAAAHETTLRAMRRSELTAALAQHGFEAVHWLMPEDSGYYQPIVVAVA
jgi:glycine/sarcosine N-methyltransferase